MIKLYKSNFAQFITSKKLKIYSVIMCFQIGTIIFLLHQIMNSGNFFRKSPIPQSGLHYFYEPTSNSVEKIKQNGLSKIATYTINSDALNERFDYQIERKQNVFRILTIGDSFTFGENVDTPNNYPEVLEDILNRECSNRKFEVINLGVRGYDIQYMTRRYQLRGVKYKPDLAIVLLENFQLYRMKEDLILRAKKMKYENPFMKMEEINDKTNRELISEYGWSALLKWQSIHLKELLSSIQSKTVVAKFAYTCSNNIYKTNWLTFECWPFTKFDQLISKLIKEKKGYFFNNLTRNRKLSFPDGHPNEEGYKAIANEIFRLLKNNNAIPCVSSSK